MLEVNGGKFEGKISFMKDESVESYELLMKTFRDEFWNMKLPIIHRNSVIFPKTFQNSCALCLDLFYVSFNEIFIVFVDDSSILHDYSTI